MQNALIWLGLCAVLLTACTPHRIDIQQGNVVTVDQLSQVKVGMDRQQVRYALGTPLTQDPFHAQRWDYFYSFKAGKEKQPTGYHISLWFEGDRLTRIEHEGELPESDYLRPVTEEE